MFRFLRAFGRFTAYILVGVLAVALIWFAANRLLDERPDSQRKAFLDVPDNAIPDDKNIAIGILGLNAPRGADFMKYGAEVNQLYEQRALWSEIQKKIHSPEELKLTVTSDQITCWLDPDWEGPKGCLPFENAAEVLDQNQELLERYKALYKLERSGNVGNNATIFISLTKLVVAEMRLDIRNGRYDAAYAKWRSQFQFVRNYLRGRDTWVGKSIGLVGFGMSLPVLEELVVRKPRLARVHASELLEVLRPGGIESFDLASSMRAEYLLLDTFLRGPAPESDPYLETIDRLAQKLAQQERFGNRYIRYSQDYIRTLQKPWPELAEEFQRLRNEYIETVGWRDLIDPFGWVFFARHVDWQLKPPTLFHQIYIADGKLRLATLVVQMLNADVRDQDIFAFLEKTDSRLKDPFTGKPMIWDSEHGRIYFASADYKCQINYFRVPVLDARGGRPPPKVSDATIC